MNGGNQLEYPKTLEAVKAHERGGYGIAIALWEEVAKTGEGNAKKGEIQRVAEYLIKNEVGESYHPSYLSSLHRLGGWLAKSSSELDFGMSPRMAMVAMDRGLSLEEAEAQWKIGPDSGGKWSLRTWAESLGKKWADIQAETAAEVVEKATASGIAAKDIVIATVEHDEEAITDAAAESPKVADASIVAVSEHFDRVDEDTATKIGLGGSTKLDDTIAIADLELALMKAHAVTERLALADLSAKDREAILKVAEKFELEAKVLRAIASEDAMTLEKLLSE